jgi:hypothetical protein
MLKKYFKHKNNLKKVQSILKHFYDTGETYSGKCVLVSLALYAQKTIEEIEEDL